jgi:hypothetical protein
MVNFQYFVLYKICGMNLDLVLVWFEIIHFIIIIMMMMMIIILPSKSMLLIPSLKVVLKERVPARNFKIMFL